MESNIKAFLMLIKEILKFRFIVDLPCYYFSPRKFFAIIDNENDKLTFKRLISYILIYWLIIFVLIYSFLSQTTENSYLQIIGVIILDFILYVFLVFPLFILTIITKPRVSIKTLIVHLVLLRLNFLLFFILFYSLFIVQENYLFAVLKGLTIYGFIFLLMFAFPFIFSYTLVNRFKIIVVSVVLVLGMTYLHSEVIYKLKPNWKYDIYSALRDPIGEEIRTITTQLKQSVFNKYPQYIDSLDSFLNEGTIDSFSISSELFLYSKEYFNAVEDSLVKLSSIVKFNSTREFIIISRGYINRLKKYYELRSRIIKKFQDFQEFDIPSGNIRVEIDKNDLLIDSLLQQVGYILKLKPDEKGLIHTSPQDAQKFRWMGGILKRNNALKSMYHDFQEEKLQLKQLQVELLEIHSGYMDKLEEHLDISIFLLENHLIVPSPY